MFPVKRIVVNFAQGVTAVIIEKTVSDPLHGDRTEEDTIEIANVDGFVNMTPISDAVGAFLAAQMATPKNAPKGPALPQITIPSAK